MVYLVLQFPFKEQAEELEDKIYSFFGPKFDDYDPEHRVVHGVLSDSWGVLLKFSDWYHKSVFRNKIINSIPDKDLVMPLEIDKNGPTELFWDELISSNDKSGRFRFSPTVWYLSNLGSEAFEIRSYGYVSVYDIPKLDRKWITQDLIEACKKVQRRKLFKFNDKVWEKVFNIDIPSF